MSLWSRFVVGVALSCVALPEATLAQQSAAPTKVIFSLDFIPLGRHAPWYAALAEGYFKDEGLDVTIIPAQGTAQAIQAVESGTANLGFVDVPSVVIARGGGSKIKVLAVNYGRAPYAIFSLAAGANVTEPRQLEGLALGSGAGSFTPKIIQGFMAQQGLDPSKLVISNVAPPARASSLLSGQVPAIEFFVMSKPGLEAGAKEAKAELRTLLLADHGLDLYSNAIVATEDFITRQPDVAKGFVRAALRGWKFAIENPEKAAADEIKYVASLKPDTIVAEINIVRDLAVTADTKKNGLGSFDPAIMAKNLDFVVKYVGVSGKAPAPQDVYATGFLPNPPVMP
ncbi:ABC transporter substrate-binding protein [Bradyrhizobium sp. Cp5.3]|uniref:ABC transporter substrate-binding protein n=1 Tax=Bradyrhizobium sp. Cp5.3 TaxID=443598 RepID=UPI000426936F|nr:ABC transporter substrate-binding protein [Bradyrhizobium sp. Cp5.3]